MRFRFSQDKRDLIIMVTLIENFGAGKIYKYPDRPAVSLVISNYADTINIIIPLFNPKF